MTSKVQYLPNTCRLLIVLCYVTLTTSLQFSDDGGNIELTIKKYFSHENSLCVVLEESGQEELIRNLHVPVFVFTQDQVLQQCGSKLTDQDGYILKTSSAANMEEHLVTVLKCINQTTLKLKTKYILIVDSSKDNNTNKHEAYSYFFNNLWRNFGIINIAIHYVRDKSLDIDHPVLYLFNPFLAQLFSITSAIKKVNLTHDIRDVMINRFQNLHGHRLKAAFFKDPINSINIQNLNEKQTVGADQGVLFKQILEEYLNVNFDFYESTMSDIFGFGNATGGMGEISNGKAEYCVNFIMIPPMTKLKGQIQQIQNGFSMNIIFVVPKPREIESWQYFQYVFQWQVCVGLVTVLVLLSCIALLFQYVLSQTNTTKRNSSKTSEISSVWKAFFSVSMKKLPTTHSQRILIAWTLLLGLVFLTLFSAQLFFLVKSKPRLASIKTFQDLHDSNLPIYAFYEWLSSYLIPFGNTSLHRLKDNLKTDQSYANLNYFDYSYLNITDRAILHLDYLVELVMSVLKNKPFMRYFEVIKEPLGREYLAVHLPAGSVYFDHFNKLNLRLTAGGIHLKWIEGKGRNVVEHYIASNASKEEISTDDPHVPLTYNDLKMAFYVLYIGLTVSLLCFFIEFAIFNLFP